MQREINVKYFARLREREKLFLHPVSILAAIEKPKPSGVWDELWAEYIDDLKKGYFELLSRELTTVPQPMEFIKKHNLDVLFPYPVSKLRERSYNLAIRELPRIFDKSMAKHFLAEKKPEWIKDEDYKALRQEAEIIMKADTLSLLLWNIVSQKSLPKTKPENITEKEWDQVGRISVRFKEMEEENKKARNEQETTRHEKTEVEKLRGKIENQLNIIHNILSDPKSIDRIEDYSDIFAPGNFDNLRKISLLLSKQEN